MVGFSDSLCDRIIKESTNMELFTTNLRKHSRYIVDEKDRDSCKNWNLVDSLIKSNLGNNYFLTTWLITLKYEKGDYFLEHNDGYDTGKRYLSGGITLSPPTEYTGGRFILEGRDVTADRGQLFTHTALQKHKITEVESGTRYVLHFCIGKNSTLL